MPPKTQNDLEIARIQKDIEVIREQIKKMQDQLPPLDRSFNDLDRSVSVYQAGMRDIPDRVAKLEHWRAGEAGDIPARMASLERWKYQTEGALGLTKWAVTGGIMGLVSLITLLITLANGGGP